MADVQKIKYAHTNLVTPDWKRLANFYVGVFDCVVVPPERDLAGRWLDDATSITHAHIQGVHVRLPGHGDSGPTLEIFQYDSELERNSTAVNRPGLGHLAFAVENVRAAHAAVIAAGGREVGQIVTTEIAGAGRIEFAYVTDPDGNVIELQQWQK
jgi:glyoxylase I family protein